MKLKLTSVKLQRHTVTMEDTEGMPILFLSMWYFFTARRQILFQKRLKAARQKTAEKKKKTGQTGKYFKVHTMSLLWLR